MTCFIFEQHYLHGSNIFVLLILVTLATSTQLKEMGGKDSLLRSSGSADASKPLEQAAEKKKGFADWMTLMKPGNEEKDHWVSLKPLSRVLLKTLFTCILSCDYSAKRHYDVKYYFLVSFMLYMSMVVF